MLAIWERVVKLRFVLRFFFLLFSNLCQKHTLIKVVLAMYNKVVRQAAVKLSSQDVATHLSKLPGWKTQGDSLEKDFKLANFEETWVRALTQF